MSELRKDFEKLPNIAEILKDEDTYWCDNRVTYVNQRVFQDSITGYLNGAWYAYKLQEDRLTTIREALDDAHGYGYLDYTTYSNLHDMT